MIILIFIASITVLVLGGLMVMAAGMADETGQNAPTWPFLVAGVGLIGTLVTLIIMASRFIHRMMS